MIGKITRDKYSNIFPVTLIMKIYLLGIFPRYICTEISINKIS